MLTMIVGVRQIAELHVAFGSGASIRKTRRLASAEEVGPRATLTADAHPAGSASRGPQSTENAALGAGAVAIGGRNGVGATVPHAASTAATTDVEIRRRGTVVIEANIMGQAKAVRLAQRA